VGDEGEKEGGESGKGGGRRSEETKGNKGNRKQQQLRWLQQIIFVLLKRTQLSGVANVVNWMPRASFCGVQHAELLVPGQTV